MSEALAKLQPDRTLALGFVLSPSADAALHSAMGDGWKLSGKWRQQHDYAIVEWNRDNWRDHKRIAYLPDGDQSGLTLEYDETRANCQPMESADYPFTDWPYLLAYATPEGGDETIYCIPLADYAEIGSGSNTAASGSFAVGGTVTAGDIVSVSIMDERWTYTVQAGDTPALITSGIAAAVNSGSVWIDATADGANVTLTAKAEGIGGNRIGWQATLSAGATCTITPGSGLLSGGASTATWHITLDFATLVDKDAVEIPTDSIRLLRWVYSPVIEKPTSFAAASDFIPCDFQVEVSNWAVSGTGNSLKVAGPNSQRIEDDDPRCAYTGTWGSLAGNSSGETIRHTIATSAEVLVSYAHPFTHDLYLGTQRTYDSAIVAVQIDGGTPFNLDLYSPGAYTSDIFPARIKLAAGLTPGPRTVRITHSGTRNPASVGDFAYFDFLEAAVADDVPDAPETRTDIGLATDYDTAARYLSPERLAWSIAKMGLKGEVNHFAGAEFWYEKAASGWVAASATVTLGGTVTPGDTVSVTVAGSTVSHAVAYGDTLATIAKILAATLNVYTGVYGSASGAVINIFARVPGIAWNGVTISASVNGGATETVTVSGDLAGGVDGSWVVDDTAYPVLNRAALDWHSLFGSALAASSIALRVALSLELKHAPSAWGQLFNDGTVVITGNGAVQCSPSIPAVVTFLQAAFTAFSSFLTHLQLGEVQWWYFAGGSPASMAFYDTQTKADFLADKGRALHVFTAPDNDPDAVNGGEDANWLRDRLGSFCAAIRAVCVYADFEVLWPRDVNDPNGCPLNYRVNLPASEWAPANYAAFKTEAFQESSPQRDMNKARTLAPFPVTLGFSLADCRHLVGCMAGYPWLRQAQVARSERALLVTLWAWDQFCAIGRSLPVRLAPRRAQFVGVGGDL